MKMPKSDKKSKRSTTTTTTSPRPTAAEILAHTAYPDAVWKLIPSQKGNLNCAVGRGGPVGIDWEVHGTGSKKIVVCFCYFCILFTLDGVVMFFGVKYLNRNYANS